jgi:hypothetical protein
MVKVYLVGDMGPEHYSVIGIYDNYDEAFKHYEYHRKSLLEDAKRMLQWSKEDAKKALERGKWKC